MEARHSKSSDSYELLGQFCGQERVIHLILPLKEVNNQCTASTRGSRFLKRLIWSSSFQILENTASLKVSRRVHAVLRRIVAGLLLNQSMSPQSILLLSHGLISESLPLITSKNKYVTHTQGCIRTGLIRSNLNNFTSHIHPERSSVYLQILACLRQAVYCCRPLLREEAREPPLAAEQTCTSWWKRDSV